MMARTMNTYRVEEKPDGSVIVSDEAAAAGKLIRQRSY